MSLGFNKIEMLHVVNNLANGRVMQKCGTMFEGISLTFDNFFKKGL
jgi:RimJ/RimL family protein N-acetyltransferase